MASQNTPMRAPWRDIAPHLTDVTDQVLFDDVWQRPELSPRDRSLVTVTALIAGYRQNELPFHMRKALENGVTREEIIEVITHLAFYSGWPTASTALTVARQVLGEGEQQHQQSKEHEDADA
jgi:4-carboxymuconolactone decarboxylase